MNFSPPGWGLMALALLCGACQPMPDVDSVSHLTDHATGLGQSIVVRTENQATDVDPQLGSTLTLLDCTRLALQQDPRIQQALAKARLAQLESQQQRLLPNPVIELTYRFPESGGAGIIEAGLTANLVALLQRPGLTSAADHRFRASHSEALRTVLDVIAETQVQYFTAQSLDARIEVAQARQKILEQLLDVTRSRVQAGEGSRLDALTVDAEQATLETELIELRSAHRRARLGLARLIGNPSAGAEWALDPWQAPQTTSASAARWINVAMEHRPELQSHVWELGALGEEVKLARLSTLDGAEIGAAAERDGDWSIGPTASLPLPVFDLGQTHRAMAQTRRLEALHQLTELRRQIVLEVRSALEQFESAQAALKSIEARLLPLQEQRRQQVQSAYTLGLADISAVQLAEQDLQAAIARRIESQEKVSIAWIELQRAVGGSAVAASVATTPPSSTSATSRSNQP